MKRSKPCKNISSIERFTYFLCLLVILPSCMRNKTTPFLSGETITYTNRIHCLIQRHCITCHHGNGPGPYDFSFYKNIIRKKSAIQFVTQSGYMPPWKPDPAYSHFLSENYLTPIEKRDLLLWLNNNMPFGDSSELENNINKTIDYSIEGCDSNTIVLEMPFEYEHPGDGHDHYMNFILSEKLNSDLIIQNAEILPGNIKIVHHAWLMTDSTGSANAQNIANRRMGFEGTGVAFPLDNLIQGYLPGVSVHPYAADMAKLVKKNSTLVLQIHYCPYYKKAKDRSKVKLIVSHVKKPRMVHVGFLLEEQILNKPFELEPESRDSFTSLLIVPKDLQIISLAPHMHYHGYSTEAYALTRHGKVPLIRINHWDFNWQGMYYLREPVKLAYGDSIIFKTQYDNTSSNMNNPQMPPVKIHYGESSKDEMCQLIYEYID